MGWRDRAKKSFADSAYIAEGVQNLKNSEKKEKEGLKTTFRHFTHNTQNTQNPKSGTDGGEDPKPDQENTTSTVKDQNTLDRTPAQNIPAPEPPGMGPEYERIWNQAWELADFIDDPDGAPIEDRRARLPELDRMRERMADIASRELGQFVPKPKIPTTTSDSEEIKQIKQPGTWHIWESSGTATRDRNPENCPARCRRTGKCYVAAYFKGKPGKPKDCEPKTCKHIANERGHHDSQTT